MDYKSFVRDAYNEAVRLHPTANSELKFALKSHERVPAFVDSVANEVLKVQDLMFMMGKSQISKETIKTLVYDLTNMFIMGIEKQAELRHESDVKKMLRQQQEAYQKDLDDSASGNLKGDFADIVKEGGVVFTEDRANVKS